MSKGFNRTAMALSARGVPSDQAIKLASSRHTLASLQAKNIHELVTLGITEFVARKILSNRPPIPEQTLTKLLYDNKWVCCVCRDEDKCVVVHHIKPWAESRSHEPENLAVLCPGDHAKAHSVGDLSQNLSRARLKAIKLEWERQVNADDSLVVRRAAQTAGEYWYFFNLQRLHEIANHEGIDLETLPHYAQASRHGILDTEGCLVPESANSMWAYTGRHSRCRYWYARDLFLSVLDRISVTNVSDRLDRSDIGNTIIRGDYIYVEGLHIFKLQSQIYDGEGQVVVGTRSANGIRITFTFDRWYATSSSAHTQWLTGRSALGSFCRVGDVSREEGKIVVRCTVLAICTELPNLRKRSYMSNSLYPHIKRLHDFDEDDGSDESDESDWGDEADAPGSS